MMPDHADVFGEIGAEDPALDLFSVGEDDEDFVGALDDVCGGEDEAIFGDDDSGAGRSGLVGEQGDGGGHGFFRHVLDAGLEFLEVGDGGDRLPGVG